MNHQPSEAAVALSGGVDCSMAAHLLKEAGWKIHGVHFELPSLSHDQEEKTRKVNTVAEFLNIPLQVIDIKEHFTDLVMTPFIQNYMKGLTPNPCISCNPLVKFAGLYRFIHENQLEYLATGHYARLHNNLNNSRTSLFRGRDHKKDQSYFLHRLGQQVLSRSLFPLGEMTKDEILTRAVALGLPSCKSKESQEICFLGTLDYRVFLEQQTGIRAEQGLIVNREEGILGEHKGVHRFTVGQRHGLGIASSRPYYVKEIRAPENKIVVARKEDLYSRTVYAEDFHWLEYPSEKNCIEVLAQIRYRHKAASGLLEILSPSQVRFTFHDPQWAVTPGQSLVCYHGDQVLGGGVITGS